MLDRFPHNPTVELDDFLRDYSDSTFGRFLLYLIVYRNSARDWDENGYRLGFDGAQVLEAFRPQWHHIFPKKFMEGKVEEEEINALANIAVIGPATNIRISAKNPMDYLDRYKIGDEKLAQQFIPSDRSNFRIENYRTFLENRAKLLAEQANVYLSELRGGTVVS